MKAQKTWQTHFSNCVYYVYRYGKCRTNKDGHKKPCISIAHRRKNLKNLIIFCRCWYVCAFFLVYFFILTRCFFFYSGSRVQTFLSSFSLCWNICVLKWNDASHFRQKHFTNNNNDQYVVFFRSFDCLQHNSIDFCCFAIASKYFVYS